MISAAGRVIYGASAGLRTKRMIGTRPRFVNQRTEAGGPDRETPMTTSDRLSTLNQRKEDLRRELADLGEAKRQSQNTALGELESALLAEMDHLEEQIGKLQVYLGNRQAEPE